MNIFAMATMVLYLLVMCNATKRAQRLVAIESVESHRVGVEVVAKIDTTTIEASYVDAHVVMGTEEDEWNYEREYTERLHTGKIHTLKVSVARKIPGSYNVGVIMTIGTTSTSGYLHFDIRADGSIVTRDIDEHLSEMSKHQH